MFGNYSVPQYVKDYLNYMGTIKGKSPNTLQVYFYDLRLFLRFIKLHKNNIDIKNVNKNDFDNIPIDDIDIELIKSITLSDIYAFMSFISLERDNSAYARARKVASIRSFFNFMVSKAKILAVNPTAELESPKLIKRLPRYLNIEESKKLLSSVEGKHSARDYAILTLFLNCGLRLSELVGINLSNIKDNKLSIIGKGNKERIIHLNPACQKAISEYLKVRSTNDAKDKDALFLSERNKRIGKTTVQHIVKKFLKQAGLDSRKYSTHKLRHTAATLMYKHGNVDIRSLQEILGHESIVTTEIYTHLDSDQLKNAVESNPLADFDPSQL